MQSSPPGRRCCRSRCPEERGAGGGSSSSWTWPGPGGGGWGSRGEEPLRAHRVPGASGCCSSSAASEYCDRCSQNTSSVPVVGSDSWTCVGALTSCSHRGRLLSSRGPVPTPSSAAWARLWTNLRPAAERLRYITAGCQPISCCSCTRGEPDDDVIRLQVQRDQASVVTWSGSTQAAGK